MMVNRQFVKALASACSVTAWSARDAHAEGEYPQRQPFFGNVHIYTSYSFDGLV